MAQICPEGQFMDRLLRECVSCSMICHDSVPPSRCSQFCVAWRCKAVSGQFYDTLLKKCLQCSELCGSHPEACADACTSTGTVFVTQRPDVGGSAVQLVPGRGRSVPGSALYSEALLYSLLGLCIIVLMFTLTAAFLLLLKRAKHQQLDTKKQQPNKHGQSSEDSLMARVDEVSQERPRATETCVYCFSEHTDLLQTHSDKSRALRIICSPTHTSIST
ncbi:tumor necrosis factor receptor superfamily member 13B-like isoform X1 [Carassius carassius]|uniref:tumor necrosis factor receptor superfamily member 13B-like isoform X1 n=1 Tax=Carassius carassius TaxID=217509 RepID=UPI002868E933|nr:tumor necrosis factor receptor superfamily member 13B-like isoform X1 [Carassius carassius]